MKIIELKNREDLDNAPKLNEIYQAFNKLLKELNDKDLGEKSINAISNEIEELNTSTKKGKGLKKLVLKKQSIITSLLEKEHKIVPKNHYRNLWMLLGMAAIGLPIGVAFGASIGNMGLLAIGLPIGMVIGLALGMGMDKKAFKEGRQLDVELKNGL